ncbi:MAG TPA: NADH-ubiquinone oxidoreductase-F iron-sulfur binding region domain-containing protein [Acidimicrobiales bacterium]|nr:NADH-ubiquinone oxidoreductase-F iron-sulfur binding region domain-containing protein [Acidimicrobiales bacterium]
MTIVHRVLYPEPITDLADYRERGGGEALEAARKVEPATLIEELEASGLRGRGGAGFPTGTKWRTVAENASPVLPATVVVNGAEGEPGTFKDRTILRNDPYQVIEGALIAARAVGASSIIFGLKKSFGEEVGRLRDAIAEVSAAGWTDGLELEVFEGPNEYLYGEETALLETLDGRYPFPRIAPPFRRGVTEVVDTGAEATSGSGLAAPVEMAGPGDDGVAPPTLVDNVETLANVPRIIARGADWFRTHGTDESPGTIVCTVTGSTQRHGVGEVPMGTPLREVIELIGGGPQAGRRIKAVLPGVAQGFIPESMLDAPVSYEGLAAIGSGLGSAGFIVFDDSDDMAAVAAGVSRFLAIESCGQCTPCKQDGLQLADLMDKVSRSDAGDADLATIQKRVDTVADGARCYLAHQHQNVLASLLENYGAEVDAHLQGTAPSVEPELIAELVDIDAGKATWDERHREKQPDWSYDAVDSGQVPAERYGEHRAPQGLEE